jgi:hypothetical protein
MFKLGHYNVRSSVRNFRSNRIANTQLYVIGTMNFFGAGEKRCLSFVEHCAYNFDFLSIVTIGPRLDQRWYNSFRTFFV